jgi:hypothetical protein
MTHSTGTRILNIHWPHHRVWKVEGVTEGGKALNVYVLDDCEGDAIESALEWADEEGCDDSGIDVRRVNGEELERVLDVVRAYQGR